MSNFIEHLPVGRELFSAERQTDRHDEANSRFSQRGKSVQKRIFFFSKFIILTLLMKFH